METSFEIMVTLFLLLGLLASQGAIFFVHAGIAIAEDSSKASCSEKDIEISQAPTPPLPNGIPTYTVEISNICASGCNISNIHVSCGWFSSAILVNPRIFKRLLYGDCLVNNGSTLPNGRTVSFKYAQGLRYPLSVSSVNC
ncbi:hypothetical protein L6164_017541 [Bauhinia variegata]|uniref:Uncharacterized protein n=1 Tax=Bauhinia variegata TaxID=167791 RepID=A0ACB9NA55_BAUVA|nr:hypothetical protein L6164_017541 [Bauhinia variegata]